MDKLLECKRIYEQAFGDEDKDFENLLFEKCFKYVKTAECDGKVCSMLFELPCVFKTEDKNFEAVYIYAAATKQEFRGRGYMSELIGEITGKKDKAVFLRPANDGLISYYEKLGFLTVDAQKTDNEYPELVPTDEFLQLVNALGIKADNSRYTAMFHNSLEIKPKQINFIFTME